MGCLPSGAKAMQATMDGYLVATTTICGPQPMFQPASMTESFLTQLRGLMMGSSL